MSLGNSSDEGAIWTRFQAGDQFAYSYIYDSYYKRLYNYGMRIVSDKVIVEDCIQDLFIRLWRRKELLGVPLSIQAYLFQSLRRCIYRSIEKQRKTGHAMLDESYDYESQSSHEMSMIDTVKSWGSVLSQSTTWFRVPSAHCRTSSRRRPTCYCYRALPKIHLSPSRVRVKSRVRRLEGGRQISAP